MQRRAIWRRSSAPVSISTFAACSPSASRAAWSSRVSSSLTAGIGCSVRKAVNFASIRSMAATRKCAGAHRQVGDAEVEERFRGAGLIASAEQLADPGQVGVDGGFERGVEQVLDRELLGEVGAGGLALAGLVVDVDLPAGTTTSSPGLAGT